MFNIIATREKLGKITKKADLGFLTLRIFLLITSTYCIGLARCERNWDT
jgi:hypothetical protein